MDKNVNKTFNILQYTICVILFRFRNITVFMHLQLGIQIGIRRHHILILLLSRRFDQHLLRLPEFLLHAGHDGAVLAQNRTRDPETGNLLSRNFSQLLYVNRKVSRCYAPITVHTDQVSCSVLQTQSTWFNKNKQYRYYFLLESFNMVIKNLRNYFFFFT